jgi:hypothetical protein
MEPVAGCAGGPSINSLPIHWWLLLEIVLDELAAVYVDRASSGLKQAVTRREASGVTCFCSA